MAVDKLKESWLYREGISNSEHTGSTVLEDGSAHFEGALHKWISN
jgi:hypothetical protein